MHLISNNIEDLFDLILNVNPDVETEFIKEYGEINIDE